MFNTSLAFTATWISPSTNTKCTAIHFSSYLNCIRVKYNRPLFVGA